jgi:hypothetical protein
VIDGRAVLALGGSDAGKSSLALAWSVAGHPSLGDDIILLEEQGHAGSFPRVFKVAPEVLESLGLEPSETPFWSEATGEAWYTPDAGPGWAEAAPVGLIAVCRHRPGAGVSTETLDRADGLNCLLHSVMPSGLDTAASFPAIVEALADAEVLRVDFESAASAAAAIASRVQ